MKIKALENWKDGNIFPFEVEQEQVIEVTLREYELVVQSGGRFEVVPDSTPVTPVVFDAPVNEPLTEKQLEAKQLLARKELEAEQMLETARRDADELTKNPEVNLHPTVEDAPQATRAAEELARKKLAEIQAKEQQEALDKANQEVRAEVNKEASVHSKPVEVERPVKVKK